MQIYGYSGSLTRPMPQYGAANGRGITHFSFDPDTGALAVLGETRGIDDTAWLVLDAHRRRLYATSEVSGTDQSALATFAIDPNSGALTPLGSERLAGGEACHASISRDGRFVLVANYNGATPEGWPEESLAVLPTREDGSVGEAACTVRHRGSGPNAERQTTAHAHCVMPSPDGRFVYAADLGMDRIVAYRLADDGSLTAVPSSDLQVSPGLGPRHIVFQPDGRLMFMVSELIPRVLAISVDPDSGALAEVASFTIERRGAGIMHPSGIIMSGDSRFLYVGLRVSNEVLALRIGPSGEMGEVGRWPSGGTTPRDLTLAPSGRHLLVANQDSDTISVFAVDGDSGALSGPVHQQPVGSPMAIVLAGFPHP